MTVLDRFVKIPQKLNNRRKFSNLQKNIHKDTFRDHLSIIESSKLQFLETDLANSSGVIVQRGIALRDSVLCYFSNKYQSENELRFLIHVPPANVSPAGFSIFSNLLDTLTYMGVACERLEWNVPISDYLTSFAPTVLLSSDSAEYLSQLDWGAINNYKLDHQFRVGLTASIEAYGNKPLNNRLRWAIKNKIDFYYSFRTPEYVQTRREYKQFFEEGFNIYHIEFGANPLLYFPVSHERRDIPFVFLGSSNSDKHSRYVEWFGQIFKQHSGFINGPGWHSMNSAIPMNLNRFIYARARVGINLHLDEQVIWANELNERTYTLAACGVPQLIDSPKLLGARFSEGAMFQANSAKEYLDLFHHILSSPDEAQAKATIALEEVYAKHTTFHRAEIFINQLSDNKIKKLFE